jgi:hypothetical protein
VPGWQGGGPKHQFRNEVILASTSSISRQRYEPISRTDMPTVEFVQVQQVHG